MPHPDDKADEVIARLAGASHGVVTRTGLLAAALTREEIRHRLGSGALRRIHRGVYRAGHEAPSTDASYLAAVYACGARAVLGGRAAAWRYGLVKGSAPAPEVLASTRHVVPGVTTRTRRLGARDVARWRGIPTLTVPATLVDLAGRLPEDELARACHEAGVRYGTTPRQVAQVLQRRPNSRGAAKLRAVMSGETKMTLSRLESRFLALLRAEGLPLPQTNRPADGRRVDCRWPAQQLTVELDSFRFHNSRHTWERDRAREREAYARDDQFRRYTWGDVFEAPEPMLTEIRGLCGVSRS